MPSLVNVHRLKPFYDQRDRPYDLPSALTNIEKLLNPDEITENDEIAETMTDERNHENEGQGSKDPGTMQTEQSGAQDNWHPVKRLLKMQKRNGKMFYQVEWDGEHEPSWEPARNVSDALIREFHVNRAQTSKRKKRRRIPWYLKK